jgi:hypothetical protein
MVWWITKHSRSCFMLLALLASSGCHICTSFLCQQKTVEAPIAEKLVSLAGSIAKPGDYPLPELPTIKKLLATSGGMVVDKDVNGQPVEMFMRFRRGNQYYFVSQTAIEETECGSILAKPDDKFEVVSWTKTDLFRGVKAASPWRVPTPPTDPGDMASLYQWYTQITGIDNRSHRKAIEEENDNYKKARLIKEKTRYSSSLPVEGRPDLLTVWGKKFIDSYTKSESALQHDGFVADLEELKKQYQIEKGSRIVTVELQNEVGEKKIPQRASEVNFNSNSIRLPKIANITDKTGLGLLGIVSLTRIIEGKESVFLISRRIYVKDDTYGPAGVLLSNANMFDGDKIVISLPQDVPIVRNSLLAAEFYKRIPKK